MLLVLTATLTLCARTAEGITRLACLAQSGCCLLGRHAVHPAHKRESQVTHRAVDAQVWLWQQIVR